jgi:uncharacterized membrane protein
MAENQNPQVNTSEQLPQNAKLFSIFAYIGLLWLLGLLISPEKTSPFVRSHVNNGIILTIFGGASSIICWIPVVGWILGGVVWVAVVVFMIMGIVAAAKTQYFTIPLVGNKIKIVK